MSEETKDRPEMKPAVATGNKAPDGGWGWVVVAASFFIHVVMDGMTYAFGVLAAEFVDSLGSTRQLNGWITSVLVSVILGSGPLVSAACKRFGNREVTIAGAVLAWIGFSVSYFVTQPWTFLITISLVAGFGISLIYLPAIVCVGIYFDRRRSTAIGIAVCGSGLGIFIFGPLINYLIDEYTWRGAMLILGGIVLNCAVFGCAFRRLPETLNCKLDMLDTDGTGGDIEAGKETTPMASSNAKFEFRSLPHLASGADGDKQQRRQRTLSADQLAKPAAAGASNPLTPPPPPSSQLLASRSAFVAASALSLAIVGPNTIQPRADSNASSSNLTSLLAAFRRRAERLFPVDLLKDPSFLLFLGSNLLFNFGFDAPFLYTPDRAQEAGYSSTKASLLLSVIGAANLVGRLVFGFVSDRPEVNKTAMYAASLAIAGVALFFSFISEAYAFMAVYCALFGVFVGAYVTLTPAVLAHLLGPERLSDSFGLTLLFQAIGVVAGPPMAGAIFDRTRSFNASYMASGACMLLSGAILFPLPCLLRWQAAKRGKTTCADPATAELPLLPPALPPGVDE